MIAFEAKLDETWLTISGKKKRNRRWQMTDRITIMFIIRGLFAASSAAADSFVINFNTGGSNPRAPMWVLSA
ncbi:hypothetical protein [Primorskyibacter flagellatus]|uniref:hypothetical protein n=1 Tax=Primorskyibacter flagellatus TaxID=1387277 RepID=UPI000A02A026|nr:hypothetical protein [Primorskyibacter flagellatus]